MDLDQMKQAWTELTAQVDRQKKLTDQLIIGMTKDRYARGIGKVRTSELAGTVLCFASAAVLLVNFGNLHSPYEFACALVCLLVLVVLPVLSLSALYRMSSLPIAELTYKELLTAYAKSKHRFFMVQKASIFLSLVMVLAVLPILPRLTGKQLHYSPGVMAGFCVGGAIFFVLLVRFVYGYYSRTLQGVEELLHELKEN